MPDTEGQVVATLEPDNNSQTPREEKTGVTPALADPLVDIPFSLPLLFLTAHVDVTLQTYHYRWNEAYVLNYETLGPWPPVHPRRVGEKRPKIFPKIKRNLVSVVQNAKHKVSRAFLCLPCVREDDSDPAYDIPVPPPAPSPSPSPSPKALSDPPTEKEEVNEEEEEEEDEVAQELRGGECKDPPSSLPLKKMLTTSETVDSGFFSQDGSNLPTPTDSQKTFPSALLRDDDWAWVTRVAAEGRVCFREARALAAGGRKEAQALRQSVATTQGRLHRAIAQLWLVESGLHDHLWELMDRDTWTTTFLLPSHAHDPHAHLQFIDEPGATLADFLADDGGCVWEWSLV